MYYTRFKTKFCDAVIVGDEQGLIHFELMTDDCKRPFEVDPAWQDNPEYFANAIKQVQEYFDGTRTTFDLRLHPIGTPFQQEVWQALRDIPCGTTCSYRDIAQTVNRPKAVRAVGGAIGRNPLGVIVPCHRVIGSNGKLTGFAHGLTMKAKLLDHEKQMGAKA